ncbi:MAG TPA: farnesyl diphosphate synthase [Clostridiaceae bacterium]
MELIKKDVEDYLASYMYEKHNLASFNKEIYEAMDYSVKAGGKRIRPLLMILVYRLYKEDYKDIIPMACAIEMIHTYSLIHDDLPTMDNDSLRRGMPTNHIVFGEAMALLAGDALLNEAMNIMFYCSLSGGVLYLEASSLISKASGVEGMIGGQVVDIKSEGHQISLEELYYMHKKKTGALICAAVMAGGIIGKASKKDLEILKEFGEKLGLTFQIKDDILNVVGDCKLLGKSVNSDIENNKTNFITVFGLSKCINLCEELTKECKSLLLSLSKGSSELIELTDFLLKREF